MKLKTKMTLIAATLISTAGMTTTASAAGTDEGKCFGINSCKGQSACSTSETSCAGHNACKGKGWVKMSQKDCQAKKGKFEALK